MAVCRIRKEFLTLPYKIFLFIFSIFITGIFTGCTVLPDESPQQEYLVEVYDIIDNQCSNPAIFITENINNYKTDITIPALDGYRTVIADFGKNKEIWRVDICTEENGSFIYRSMEYQIPVYEGNGYLIYQIPGSCKDYMIFLYHISP